MKKLQEFYAKAALRSRRKASLLKTEFWPRKNIFLIQILVLLNGTLAQRNAKIGKSTLGAVG